MDVEKNGGSLFRRPKLTLSCSAEGKEGRIQETVHLLEINLRFFTVFKRTIKNVRFFHLKTF
jgi:hypothetical protein